MDLGGRIIHAYKSAGMTRAEFARRLNTVYHQVLRWERGATPGLDTLRKIANITGASLEWLLHGQVRERKSAGYVSVERHGADIEVNQSVKRSSDTTAE